MQAPHRALLRSALIAAAIGLGCVGAQAATPGLDARVPIGPYFNGVLPASALNQAQMPALLSATGIFTDMATLAPNPAMVPFTVNSALWSDASEKLRWLVLPFDGTIGGAGSPAIAFSPEGKWTFPNGTVWVKHFQIKVNEQTNEVKRLETRFMVRDNQGNLYGNSYRWNSAQTDAAIVTALQGERDTITITRANGSTETQEWHYPGPGQCLECHNNANPSDPNGTGQSLGIKTRQLNGNYTYSATGRTANQLLTFSKLGMLSPAPADQAEYPEYEKLAPLHDATATLEKRVRSYVDANCGYCHGGTGSPGPVWDARYTTPLLSQNIAHHPTLNPLGVLRRFDIDNSRLRIRDGVDPRVTAFPTPMPPLARNVPHAEWLALLSAYANYPFDTTAAVAVGSPTQIRVRFDRAVDPLTAVVASNYSVSNGISVSAAAIDAMDPAQVILTVSTMADNTSYSVTVNRVREAQGVMNPIWPNTYETFTYLSAPLAQTINFAAIADKFKGDPPFTISATGGASGNPVVFTSSTPAVCSVGGTNGSLVTLTGTSGLCVIVANQAGNASYAAAAPMTRAFKVKVAWNFVLESAQLVPLDASMGLGTGSAIYDGSTRILSLSYAYSGLEGTSPVAELRRGSRTVAGTLVTMLPSGPLTGHAVTLDLAQELELLAGNLHVQIATSAFPQGELRGQIDSAGSAGKVLKITGIRDTGAAYVDQPLPLQICPEPGCALLFAAGTSVNIHHGTILDTDGMTRLSAYWAGCDTVAYVPNTALGDITDCQVAMTATRKLSVTYWNLGVASPPRNVTATNGVFFFQPPEATRGGVITGYQVSCSDGVNVVTAVGAGAPLAPNLANDTDYQCTVRALTLTDSSPSTLGTPSAPVLVRMHLPVILQSAHSVKTHRTSPVPTDHALPINIVADVNGPITIEPRGGDDRHTIVLAFNLPISAVGNVTAVDPDGMAIGSISARRYENKVEVRISNMPKPVVRATILVEGLNGVDFASVAVGFLFGDVNASKTVSAADVVATKRRIAQSLDGNNFMFDFNLDGSIGSADLVAVKNRAGLRIP